MPLPNIKKCIVFDFDCTLTNRHYYYFLYNFKKFVDMYSDKFNTNNKKFLFDMKSNEITKHHKQSISSFQMYYSRCDITKTTDDDINRIIDIIFGGRQRYDQLIFFFDRLKKAGVTLCISTLGSTKSVYNLLVLTSLNNYFTIIHGANNKTVSCINPDKIYINKFSHNINISKSQFLESYILPNYDIVLYIDDDHSHSKALYPESQIKYGHFDVLYYTTNKNKKNHVYYFVKTLRKEDGGIESNEISLIYKLMDLN